MILRYLSEGFLLGIATGHLCLFTCGFIYSPYLMQRGANWSQSLINLLKISIGRFITYTLFGIGAGIVGREIGQLNRSWFTAVAYVLLSIVLFISAFRTHQREKGCIASRWGRFADSPFLLGVVTGINFCPSFLIALTRAVDLSGPVSGGLLFMAFFFGTNIYLIPLAVFGVIGNKKIFRILAIISSVCVGTWFISLAGISTFKMIKEQKQLKEDFEEKIIISVMDSSRACILTKDTSTFTALRDTLMQHRAGEVYLIDNIQVIPDSGYVLIDYKWPEETGIKPESIKRPGRFVIVLPQPADDSIYSDLYAWQLIEFFNTRYFKLDKEHGSFFNMGNSVFGRERR